MVCWRTSLCVLSRSGHLCSPSSGARHWILHCHWRAQGTVLHERYLLRPAPCKGPGGSRQHAQQLHGTAVTPEHLLVRFDTKQLCFDPVSAVGCGMAAAGDIQFKCIESDKRFVGKQHDTLHCLSRCSLIQSAPLCFKRPFLSCKEAS